MTEEILQSWKVAGLSLLYSKRKRNPLNSAAVPSREEEKPSSCVIHQQCSCHHIRFEIFFLSPSLQLHRWSGPYTPYACISRQARSTTSLPGNCYYPSSAVEEPFQLQEHILYSSGSSQEVSETWNTMDGCGEAAAGFQANKQQMPGQNRWRLERMGGKKETQSGGGSGGCHRWVPTPVSM